MTTFFARFVMVSSLVVASQAQGVWTQETEGLAASLRTPYTQISQETVGVHALDGHMAGYAAQTQRLVESAFPGPLPTVAEVIANINQAVQTTSGLPDYFTGRYQHACSSGYKAPTDTFLQVAGRVIDLASACFAGEERTSLYAVLVRNMEPSNGSLSAVYNNLFAFCMRYMDILRPHHGLYTPATGGFYGGAAAMVEGMDDDLSTAMFASLASADEEEQLAMALSFSTQDKSSTATTPSPSATKDLSHLSEEEQVALVMAMSNLEVSQGSSSPSSAMAEDLDGLTDEELAFILS